MKRSLLMPLLAMILCVSMTQANAQTIPCVDGASISNNKFCIFLKWNSNAPSASTLASTTLIYSAGGTNKDSVFVYDHGVGTTADPATFKIAQGGSGSCNATSTTITSLSGQILKFLLNNVGTTCFVAAPLPITLSSFTANANGSSVSINWTTEMEKDVNYFSVQRSTDGTNWKEVAKNKPAAVSSNLTQHYSYTDNVSEISGQVYYRLVTVDYNDAMSFSNVTIVRIAGNGAATPSKVYPTVTNGKINISTAATDAVITLSDLMGAKVAVAPVSNGQMDIQTLPAGMYILNIFSKQGNESFKIVKQ